MPRAEWKNAAAFPVAVPPPEMAADFSAFTQAAYEQVASLTRESRLLNEIRDALIAPLVSGRRTVAARSQGDVDLTAFREELVA
jgi:hypothetical protein